MAVLFSGVLMVSTVRTALIIIWLYCCKFINWITDPFSDAVPSTIVLGGGYMNSASLRKYGSPYVISFLKPLLTSGKTIIGVFSVVEYSVPELIETDS